MSVHIEGPKPPSHATVLSVMDDEAKEALKAAQGLLLTAIRQDAPGSIAKTFKGSVRKSTYGLTGTVRSKDFRIPMIEKGTGLYGPRHHRIAAKRGKMLKITLPGGQVIYRRSAKGMKPHPFVERAADRVEAQAEAMLVAGADHVAARLRRER